MTQICVSKLTIIGFDNGLSPGRRQAIIGTNAGILLIWTLGTNFSETLSEIHIFSLKKMRLKGSSAKWRPSCLGLNVLTWMMTFQILARDDEHIIIISQISFSALPGVWVTMPFCYFPNFSASLKYMVAMEYNVNIWHVSPQHSCGDTCQIWMWCEESNRYFARSKILLMEKLTNRALVTPTPVLWCLGQSFQITDRRINIK